MQIKTTLALAMALSLAIPAQAELKSNDGIPYLLSLSKDVSTDFSDMSNTYFFADSLISFDTMTGKGVIEWKRQQLMPRQAFNTNTYLHQPLKSLDFPDNAYQQNPNLAFSITPIDGRTLRVRISTSHIVNESVDTVMLVAEPKENRSAWTIARKGNDVVYSSAYGTLEVKTYPWRLVLKDKSGKVLTQTRAWQDNDSTQIKVAPFSFIKRGSDNSRSVNPVFSIMPGEKIYGCGESATALNKVGRS